MFKVHLLTLANRPVSPRPLEAYQLWVAIAILSCLTRPYELPGPIYCGMKSHSTSHFLKHALHSETSSYRPNLYQYKPAQTPAKECCLSLLLKDMVFPSTEALTISGNMR